MNFCPECGSKNEGFKFCPNCGFGLSIENQEANGNKAFQSNPVIKSVTTKLENNIDKNVVDYFEVKENLYIGFQIPEKELKKLIRTIDVKNENLIKRLEHFLFYSEQSSSAIGGWDIGFTLSKYGNKIYLAIASDEKTTVFSPMPVTTTKAKSNLYEIYDLEKQTSVSEISINGDKLCVTQISNDVSFTHSINGVSVYNDLVDFCYDIQKGTLIILPTGIIISESEWKSINSLSTGEKISNFFTKIFIYFGAILILILLISAFFSRC